MPGPSLTPPGLGPPPLPPQTNPFPWTVTVAGMTVTLNADGTGQLSVPIVLSDGTSTVFTAKGTFTPPTGERLPPVPIPPGLRH